MSPTFGGYILKKLGVFQVILILNMQPETSSQDKLFTWIGCSFPLKKPGATNMTADKKLPIQEPRCRV